MQARETIWHIIVHLVTCQAATPLGASLRKVDFHLSQQSQHDVIVAWAAGLVLGRVMGSWVDCLEKVSEKGYTMSAEDPTATVNRRIRAV